MTGAFDLQAAHKHSSRHRDELARSRVAGCFHCMSTFPVAEITEWLDEGQCAVCPRCGIDSVIGDASSLPVSDPAFLDAMNLRWFGAVNESLWKANGKDLNRGKVNG